MAGDIGYRLKRAREARGLTVDEVAERIRIDRVYLMAMEEGQFDALPSSFYARSYLRSYAHFLGLDASAILREFRERTLEPEPLDDPVSRRWSQKSHRPSNQEEEGYQWPLPERVEDPEPSPLTRRGRARGWIEEPPYEPEPSGDTPYRSAHARSRMDVSREDVYHDESPSADPASYGQSPPPSHPTKPLRRPSMPEDVPPPSEIGLPMRSTESRGRSLPVAYDRNHQADSIPHLSRRRKAAAKEKESAFGKWYNRFLIAGTVLLIPAALAVGILIWGDKTQSTNAGDHAEVSADGESEKKDPIVYPLETSKGGPDHFELTQADNIELKVDAKGECRIEVREQEVGKSLKEVTLKSDSPPFAYESGKEDLWIELKPSKSAKVSVNGKPIGEYEKQKVIHIRLVK